MNNNQQSGISLLEILVALAIGVVLLNGVIQVVISNGNATKTISGFSSQQENARVALEDLSEALRSAGHFGGTEGETVESVGTLSVTGIGGCNSNWLLDTATHIQGFEGKASVAAITDLPTGCIPADQYTDNTDIVVLRYASAKGATPIASVDNATLYYRSVFGTTGAQGAELLMGADIGDSAYGGGVDGVGTYNYQYKSEVYFVRPCSSLNGSNCEDGLHTLVRYTLESTDLISEAIAEGVEQFQLSYGVDSVGGDYVADNYVTAENVADWNTVVSARFSIVVRSDNRNLANVDTNTYTLAGGYEYTPEDEVAVHSRKVFTRVVQLRNMSRG
ncbi:MAG: PilW family protein [Cellvibrionaceae bacterium]|nr:PilW family protein [Cellvibrionaceae bacterium]